MGCLNLYIQLSEIILWDLKLNLGRLKLYFGYLYSCLRSVRLYLGCTGAQWALGTDGVGRGGGAGQVTAVATVASQELDSLLGIPGFGLLAWIPRFGVLSLDSWV